MGFSEKEQLCVLEKEGRDYVLLSVACPASSALALPSEHSEVLCSDLPDVKNGNLILMAHSGWASISYFEYLYNLRIGDYAYVTYEGNKYSYKLTKVYDVPKTGKVKIVRNYDKTTLTLITCTRNSMTLQTVYILELV